jgi:hypothetical protein
MASGFGGYAEFLNIMRSDTMEEGTPSTQVMWFAVDNTTIGIEKSLLDFDDLRNVDLTQLASPGEGWGSVTENFDVNFRAPIATAATIHEAFTWMATFPGMVLIGTFTLGGKFYYYTEFKIS